MSSLQTLEQILELAKWAPSGDNTQPWRFEIVNEGHVAVHGFDTRTDCVYDIQGHASQIAMGALLENMVISASGHALRTDISYRTDSDEEHPVFDVHFSDDPALHPNPLLPHILNRSVQRRPLSTRLLTMLEKDELSASLGPKFRVLWAEGISKKMAMARILSDAGKLRLTIPEAYQVHRKIIHWGERFSEDRVPDQAIGLDALTLILMRWVMERWKRVEFFNTFLAGTILPRLQLDIIPALACGAHFFILPNEKPSSLLDYVMAGRNVQRFWLTATKLGLQLQPEMSPLIFRKYFISGISVSRRIGADESARKISHALDQLIEDADGKLVFMGRIGAGRAPKARSLRLPLDRLRQFS